MTRVLVVTATIFAAVGVAASVLALIGSSTVETFVANGQTTTTSHQHFGSFVPAALAFALAVAAGLAALLSRILTR